MKLSEFILLGETEKRKIVLLEGRLIAKRKNQEKMVFLFQLESFYVETYFHLDNKAIDSFLIFRNTSALEPYLKGIHIDDLINWLN